MPTILVVDDEPIILKVFGRALEKEGRRVLLARSADEALAQARQHAPLDLVLLDKNLGDRSGLDVARQLLREQPGLAVILVTGYASLPSAIEALQIGAYDYVAKPIEDFASLELKVANAMEKVRLAREHVADQARLAESEARYRQLFDAAPDAILALDLATQAVAEVNPAAVALFGYGRDELLRLQADDLFAPPRPQLEGAGPGGAAVTVRCIKRDGTVFPAEVRRGDLTLGGRPLRTLTMRDVTERERLQAERRAVEEQLRQAQKMDAVGRLASGLGHDLGNMLAIILTYAGLARERAPRELQEDLDAIATAGERAANLTRQLMTVARAGPSNPAVLALNEAVAETARLLRKTLGERIQLVTRLGVDLPAVRVDPNHLAQVLINLAVNARDAMPRGGTLTLTTEPAALAVPEGQARPVDGVAITVSDTGVGMSGEVCSRLFEPFFTTKERGKGTGLGLAVVYGIVRQAGGTIEVQSRPGAGATFRIVLPRASVEAACAGVREAAPRRRVEDATVLVAEDEDALRSVVARVLTGAGLQVVEARSGDEALERARAHAGRLDLLLSDVVMPGMSGTELASALHRERPELKVLYMTGFPSDTQSALVLAEGAAVLHKPFKHVALLDEVRRLLEA